MEKQIMCPRCERRLFDAHVTTEIEAKISAPGPNWQPDFYLKCWKCSSKVGIKVFHKK